MFFHVRGLLELLTLWTDSNAMTESLRCQTQATGEANGMTAALMRVWEGRGRGTMGVRGRRRIHSTVCSYNVFDSQVAGRGGSLHSRDRISDCAYVGEVRFQ